MFDSEFLFMLATGGIAAAVILASAIVAARLPGADRGC